MATDAGADNLAIARLVADIAALKEGQQEIKDGLAEVNRRLDTGLREARVDLDTGLGLRNVRADLDTGLRNVRADLDTGLRNVRADLEAGLRETNRRIDRLFYAVLAIGSGLLATAVAIAATLAVRLFGG
jgi:hypothetical protein